MVSSAGLALALVWSVQMLPRLPGPLLCPGLLGALAAFAWFLWGPRIGLATVPAIGALLSSGWAIDDRLDPRLSQQDILVEGTVCEFPRRSPGVQRFVLEPSSRHARLPKRIYLSWYDAARRPEAGERWQFKVRLKRPRGLSNPGGFDFERWAHEHRLGAAGYVRRSASNHRVSAFSADCLLVGLRNRIAVRLKQALGGRAGFRFLKALSVGARNELTTTDWALLRRTGTVHLMAISGLHIGLVTGLMYVLGRQIGILFLLGGVSVSPLFSARLFGSAGAIIYSGLAGFSVPTLRALVMVLVAMLLASVRRAMSGWQILAAALMAVMIVDTSAALSPGFWLSFYAVAILLLRGLTLKHRGPESGHRLKRAIDRGGQLVHAQIALTIGLAPLSILFFDQLSLISTVANLIVIPVFVLVIAPLTLIGSIALLLSTSIARFALEPAAQTMELILQLLTWLDRVPWAAWSPPSLSSGAIPAAFFVSLMLVWPRPVPGRFMAAMLLIPILAGSSRSDGPALRAVVMDVGQGLSVLVQTRDHALLFDTGPAFRSSNAGDSVVLPVLRHFGVSRLDALVISHGDADHVGGASSVLNRFPDSWVVAPERFESIAGHHTTCRAGMEWSWDGVRFRFLRSGQRAGTPRWSENDDSCVLLVSSEQGRILLPGDIELRAESALIGGGLIPEVDLVVAPHHGSASSSSAPFVAATRPKFVVFSVGYRNRWGFPAPDVATRWRRIGARVITTADSGAVIFETDGDGPLKLRMRYRVDVRRIWTELNP